MPRTNQTKPFHILLADDDKDDHFFFDRALQTLTFPVSLKTVFNGEQLMAYLLNNTAGLPEVIFLDINMPRKNGIESLAEIKTNETLKRIPVIIYSTSLQDEIADALYQKGAHYYLQKCEFSELKKRIPIILALVAENPIQPPRDKFVLTSAMV